MSMATQNAAWQRGGKSLCHPLNCSKRIRAGKMASVFQMLPPPVAVTMMMNDSVQKDRVAAQARPEILEESSADRGESSDDCRMPTEMVQMLRDAVDHSKHGLRRLGKLG